MHVLLVHQAFAALDEPGGTRHHELARILTRAGHEVTVLAGGESYMTGERTGEGGWIDEHRDDLGVRIIRCASIGSWHRSFFHRILSFLSFMLVALWAGLRVKEVDVVWGTSPPIFQGFTARYLAAIKRCPFVFEVRDLWPYFAIAVGVLENPLLIGAARGLERYLYRAADRVVVNSPGFVEHVSQRGARAITVVPNGVDSSMFNPEAAGEAFRERHGLGDCFVVLYAGAHGMSNDLEVLIEAAEIIGDPELCFVLLGDGKEKAALQGQASRRGVSNVRFLRPVPKDRMVEALAAADACLAILKPLEAYKTTYPNKVFDYMAAGRPVLLAIDGVIREVVERAGAGVFVPPGAPEALAAAVRDLAADRARAVEMGRRGRAYVEEHFEREDQALVLLQVFGSVSEGTRA